MPYVLQINGRTVVLDDQDARGMLDQLVRQTRIQLWNRAGGPDSYFSHYYRVWEQHNRCHAVNLFVLAMEALGGANLPPANWANRLRRTQQQLGRMIRPASIGNFYQQYPNWNRAQARFVRDMKTYMNRMQTGAGRTVTVLELTRDSSFAILGVCASILTAGAGAGGGRPVSRQSNIGRAVDRMLGRQPIDIRRILESSAGERDNRGHANVMADGLMQNRNFRRLLGEELQNQA